MRKKKKGNKGKLKIAGLGIGWMLGLSTSLGA